MGLFFNKRKKAGLYSLILSVAKAGKNIYYEPVFAFLSTL
jgi:hypothetical protein